MANMSYCRFRNTLADLRDCRIALSEVHDFSELSRDEGRAAVWLIKTCIKIAEDYGDDIDAIVDELDQGKGE